MVGRREEKKDEGLSRGNALKLKICGTVSALTGSKIASPIVSHTSYLGARQSDFYQLAWN